MKDDGRRLMFFIHTVLPHTYRLRSSFWLNDAPTDNLHGIDLLLSIVNVYCICKFLEFTFQILKDLSIKCSYLHVNSNSKLPISPKNFNSFVYALSAALSIARTKFGSALIGTIIHFIGYLYKSTVISKGLSKSFSKGCLVSLSERRACSVGMRQSIRRESSRMEMPPSASG